LGLYSIIANAPLPNQGAGVAQPWSGCGVGSARVALRDDDALDLGGGDVTDLRYEAEPITNRHLS